MMALAKTADARKKEKGFKWGRLLWTAFVVVYLMNFTNNLFHDVAPGQAAIPIIYFFMWLLWLGVEFFLEALFYQSSLVPQFNPWLKAAFAIYYYGLQGLAPWDMFGGAQIRFLFPVINILGLLVFAAGIGIRLWSLFAWTRKKKEPRQVISTQPWKFSSHPRYIGMLLIMFAAPLVFFSPWAILATVAIGLPIWYLSVKFEERALKKSWGKTYEEYLSVTPLRPRFKR